MARGRGTRSDTVKDPLRLAGDTIRKESVHEANTPHRPKIMKDARNVHSGSSAGDQPLRGKG